MFEALLYIPVSVSLVKVKDGAAAVPSASCTTPENEGESLAEMVIEPPKLTSPPPLKFVPALMVTLELERPELGILVKVFDEPDKLLLVRVWVVSVPSRVVVASGRVMILKAVGVQVRVPVDNFKATKVGEEAVDTS